MPASRVTTGWPFTAGDCPAGETVAARLLLAAREIRALRRRILWLQPERFEGFPTLPEQRG